MCFKKANLLFCRATCDGRCRRSRGGTRRVAGKSLATFGVIRHRGTAKGCPLIDEQLSVFDVRGLRVRRVTGAQFTEAGAHDFLEAITETDAVLEGAARIAQACGGVETGLAIGGKARIDLDLLRRRRRNESDRDKKWNRSREHTSHAVSWCDLGCGSRGEEILLTQIH